MDFWMGGVGGRCPIFSRYDLTLLLVFFSLSEPDDRHSPITTRLLNGWGGRFRCDRAADTTS